MPLSLNSPIQTTDIQEIKDLGSHGNVWLLKGFHQDKIVVKLEKGNTVEIKSANVGIKAIAPSAKLKILSPTELTAIDQYILNFEEAEKEYKLLGMPLSVAEKQATKNFKNLRFSRLTFLKMEPVNVMDLGESYWKRMDGDKRDLRAFIATLNDTGGLERLGKIIAVDLFIQNGDRFWPNDDGFFRKIFMDTPDGGVDQSRFKTRCLVNVGNVFRIDTGNGAEVGALDFVGSVWDINKPLAECEKTHGKWGGRYLADKAKLNSFAKDVAHDLETVLNPHRSKFSLKSKLKGDAARRIVHGMVEGVQAIKLKLEQKYNPNRWTAGVLERYKILCQLR